MSTSPAAPPRILLLGAQGQLGRELQRALQPAGVVSACARTPAVDIDHVLDLNDGDALDALLADLRPQIIVNAAAYTAVDRAEAEPQLAMRLNAELPARLARHAAASGARLVHYSTDYVFDGAPPAGGRGYVETDATAPACVYGRSKLEGERAVLADGGAAALVLRLSWVFGEHGGNFPKTMLRLAREREALSVVADQHGCPTPAALAADVTLLALRAGLAGLYHLCGAGATNWHRYAHTTLAFGRDAGLRLQAAPEALRAITSADYPQAARRPAWSVLDCGKLERALGLRLPPWQPYLRRLVQALAAAARAADAASAPTAAAPAGPPPAGAGTPDNAACASRT